MSIRDAQVLLVFCIGAYSALVAFGNLTDYNSNYVFVQHVLTMDTVPASAHIHYRAIHTPALHMAAYALIISAEAITALLCLLGAWRMLRNHRNALRFRQASRLAIAGLSLGFATWQLMFMTVAGEWFGMWMSHEWNGLNAAFRVSMTILGVLIFVALPSTTEPIQAERKAATARKYRP